MTVLSVIMGLLAEYLDKFLVKVLSFEVTYDVAVGTDEKCAGNECDVIATRLTVVSGIIQYASRLVGRLHPQKQGYYNIPSCRAIPYTASRH